MSQQTINELIVEYAEFFQDHPECTPASADEYLASESHPTWRAMYLHDFIRRWNEAKNIDPMNEEKDDGVI